MSVLHTRFTAVSIVSLLGLAGILGSGGGGGGGGGDPKEIGAIDVQASYGASQGEACAPGTSGNVNFRVEPVNLTSSDGLTSAQGKPGPISQLAVEIARDIESGTPFYGCTASATFSNLATGTWKVSVSGSVPSGECVRTVTRGANVKAHVHQGVCQ